MIRLFCLCCCFLSLSALTAQETINLDVLHLRNGQKIYGKVLEWDSNRVLIFQDSSGVVADFERPMFRRVTYTRSSDRHQPETANQQLPATSTWYHRAEMTYTFGKSDQSSDFFNNPNSDAIIGYHLAYYRGRNIGSNLEVGLGVIYASYTRSRRERTVGAGLQARYFLGRELHSPQFFVQMESAFELPIGSDDQKIQDRKGGLAVHPSVGLLLGNGSSQKGRLSFDIGYRFLETSYRASTLQGSELRSPKYRRLVFRAAYTFE